MNLRPHHFLCIRFFEGKGYSDDFIRNMERVISEIGDKTLTLYLSCDEVCKACPHNVLGACASADKVRQFDRAVLRLTGLREGETVSWEDMSALVSQRILSKGRLSEVCGCCQWFDDICSKK